MVTCHTNLKVFQFQIFRLLVKSEVIQRQRNITVRREQGSTILQQPSTTSPHIQQPRKRSRTWSQTNRTKLLWFKSSLWAKNSDIRWIFFPTVGSVYCQKERNSLIWSHQAHKPCPHVSMPQHLDQLEAWSLSFCFFFFLHVTCTQADFYLFFLSLAMFNMRIYFKEKQNGFFKFTFHHYERKTPATLKK